MKGIFKVLLSIILLLGVVGGVILVQKKQETRKGAAANETSVSILPGSVVVTSGKNFDVHTWVNTGKSTDKLSGVEYKVGYDSTKLKYISSEAQNGYTVLNEVVDDGKGTLTLKMVTLGAEKAGAVDVLKVTFQPLGNVSGSLIAKETKVLISGQSATWNVTKYNVSKYAPVSGATSTPKPTPTGVKVTPPPVCDYPAPPQNCVYVNGLDYNPSTRCGKILNCPTITQPLQCGWCGTSCVDSKIKKVCPMVEPPSNQSCVAENGACVIKNIGKASSVTLMGRFEKTTVIKGDEVTAYLVVSSGENKVSAVSMRAMFNPEDFDIVSVVPINTPRRQNVGLGAVDLYLTWNVPVTQLPSNPEFAKVTLKTKKSGVKTFNFDSQWKNEVSGVDSAGKSVGFNVLISGTVPRLIITDPVVAPRCLVCASGLAKSMGNGNCDSAINSIDFEIWRNEMFDQSGVTGKLLPNWNADYNCDQKVSGVDFEIWRATVFK